MEKQLKLFFEFLETDKKLSNNTLQSYKRDIKQYESYLELNGKAYNEVTNKDMKEYIEHLKYVKKTIDSLPETSVGKNILVLDNWNEWSEGHYIAPNAEHGFKKLQAIRQLFTKCDNLPDYRMPDAVGLGPYDDMWK